MRAVAFDRRALVLSALTSLGCDFGTLDDLSQEEASAGSSETSQQALKLWKAYPEDDAAASKAIADITAIVDRAGARPVQVTIDDLKKQDLGVPTITRDSALAQGMLVITELDCSLDQATRYVIAKNQADIYPKSYDKYERTFTSNAKDFANGAAPNVGWKTAYTVSLLGRTYEAKLTGSARRITNGPNGKPIILSRTILDAPATFIQGDDAEFNQDYQIEAYYEIGPQRVIHFYGMWREFRVSSLSSRDNLYINTILGSLVDFDVRTSKVCRDKTPEPILE